MKWYEFETITMPWNLQATLTKTHGLCIETVNITNSITQYFLGGVIRVLYICFLYQSRPIKELMLKQNSNCRKFIRRSNCERKWYFRGSWESHCIQILVWMPVRERQGLMPGWKHLKGCNTSQYSLQGHWGVFESMLAINFCFLPTLQN